MELLQATLEWFTTDGRWTYASRTSVPFRVLQHLWLTLVGTGVAVVLAVPPACLLAHRRKAEALATGLVNLGRSVPSFGLVVVMFVLASRIPWMDTRHLPLVVALVALALPPIFTNAYTAIREVDAATVEAARGMGCTEREVLRQVELPLASPVLLAGIRIALLQVIATVAIGALVTDTGGVGAFIVRGFAQGAGHRDEVLAGALLLAALTLVADRLFTLLERRLVPAQAGGASLAQVADRAGAAA